MIASALLVRKRATLWRATGALVVLGATYVLPALTLQAVGNLARGGREVRYESHCAARGTMSLTGTPSRADMIGCADSLVDASSDACLLLYELV
jgi:hypothetical protein